jgi:hypothetical protein
LKRVPGLKSTGTVNTLVASSKSTALTDHGAPIPSAASNTLAVISNPVSAFNQTKSYPFKFSESHNYFYDEAHGNPDKR